MRLLFAHDHRFLHGPGTELYTTGCLPASVWDRYLEYFDEVHVIARSDGARPTGLKLGRADQDGVEFDFLPNLSSLRSLLFRSPELDKHMREAVAAADAVVARLPSEIGQLAVRHAREVGKPYAVEVVGCAWDGYFNHGSATGRLYAPLAFLRTRRAVAGAPLAIYVTSKWLQRRYPTRGDQSNASNVHLSPMTAEESERRQSRLSAIADGKPPVLGTIASLHVRSKGVQTAFAALAKLRKKGLRLEYRILGSGPVERWRKLAVKLGIADCVHFDGTRSAGEGVFGWLDGIDVYLQPSFQEGLPRSTIEAMNRGAACVGSTCGGIPELLPPGRVHRPGDVSGLAGKIEVLATSPAAIAQASREDRETAREYDRDALKSRRSEFYGRLRKLAEDQQAKR